MSQEGLPLVTIVTPVLNGARFLPENLASIRAQDYPSVEHVVVDGGSTDGTLELLREAPAVVWTSGPDRGMYDAINRGFRMARGEILAYQNADDRYAFPGAVSAAVRLLLEHPEMDVVYGGYRYIGEDGREMRNGLIRPPEFALGALLRHNFVPPHSTFVRARVVREEGHWLDPDLQFAGDWEWAVRMAQAGKVFARLDAVLSDFRRHRRSKTDTLGLGPKLSEWRRICRRRGISFTPLLWYELVYMPLRRRLGLRGWGAGLGRLC